MTQLGRICTAAASVTALVGGLLAAMIPFAGPASALPCYAAECVPNVPRNVAPHSSCTPGKYFNYALAPDGGTLVCNKVGVWTPTEPLIGVYNVALPCENEFASAQGSDGVAFQCLDMGGGQLRWVHRLDTLE